MALTPSGTITVTNVDTATYTDTTNFGAPEPERSEYALFVEANKVNIKSQKTPLTLTPDTSNPTTVSTWTWPYTVDGWVNINALYVPVYDPVASYATNDVVYSGSLLYKAIAPSTGVTPPNVGSWTVVEATDIIALIGEGTFPANCLSYVGNIVLSARLAQKFGNFTAENAAECCSDCERSLKVETYEYLGMLTKAIDVLNERARYADGERVALSGEKVSKAC